MSSLHLPINTAVSSSAGAGGSSGGSSSGNRNRGPSPASSSSTHHEPKLLPQSPQDSPVRGAAAARGGGHAGYVTGAGASPMGGGSSDIIGDAAGTSTSGGPGSVAVTTWEIESHGVARKAPLAASLAPALLQKLIFGLGASFGFNALVVANGCVRMCAVVFFVTVLIRARL